MNVASMMGFGIFMVALVTAFRRDADPFAPGRVFVLIWSAAIGLAALNLSGFQGTWSLKSWVVLLLGLLAFLSGVSIPLMLCAGGTFLSVREIRRKISAFPLNENFLFFATILLFILYSFSLTIETAAEGTVPIFSPSPDVARVRFGIFGIHLFVVTMPVIMFLVVEYFTLIEGKQRRKTILAIVFLLTAASFFLLLQRFAFVTWLLTTVGFLYYVKKTWNWRWFFLTGIAFLGVLVFLQSIRLVRYVENYVYVISRMKYPVTYAPLTEPYMYIVMNLENFARGVEKLDSFTFGYYSFDFLMALTGMKHWLADYFNLVERPFLVSGYNTFPFLWPYFNDFGIAGVLIMPLLLGLVIGFIYVRLRKSPTLMVAVLYANAFCFISLSFFTNILTMLGTVFDISLIILVHVIVSYHSSPRRAALQQGVRL